MGCCQSRGDQSPKNEQTLIEKKSDAPADSTKNEGDAPSAAYSEESKAESKSEEMNRLTVYVIQGRNLPRYDFGPNAKSDPYVIVHFGDLKHAKYRTSKIRRELNPIWNATFTEEGIGLFEQVPRISFEVFDHDKISADDFMGGCHIEADQHPDIHYQNPVQWLPLLSKDNKPVTNEEGKPAEIQVSVKYTLNTEDVNIRYYTHIMQFTVKSGKNIRNTDLFSKSDPYVLLEWGAQSYETKVVQDTTQPVWNETAFIFIHEEFQSKYQLKLSVMDKDLHKDDHVGTGYLSGAEIMAKCKKADDLTVCMDVPLQQVPVDLDRGLSEFQTAESFKAWGDLEVEIKLKPKEEVDKEFYTALIQTFDKNDDGVIDRDEVVEMFAELKIPEDAEEFFSRFDENNDSKLDEKEVVAMLQNSDFQGSELATQLMDIYLRGDLRGDAQRHLMSGFSHQYVPSNKTIKIKDRETGLYVQEFIPSYVWYAFKLLYDQKLGRATISTKATRKILLQMSKKRGVKMDSPQSKPEIDTFIRQHNLDTSLLYKKPAEFATFNDFFARAIKVDKYRPLDHADDETVVVSPADCRLMCFNSILDSTKFWVKGNQFTVENMCGANTSIDYNKYMGGSFVIARLAPQDYHRWHWPIGGKVKQIEHIDGALYSVNPIVVNKPLNVYTDNKRAVVEIDSEDEKIGGYLMFVIAATLVGSYKLFQCDGENPGEDEAVPLEVGSVVKRGDLSGEFRFGGSTILLLFEPNKVKFDDDIVRNVTKKFETLVKARMRIGRIQ